MRFGIKLTDILTPEMVVPELRATTKSEVLAELADAFCKQHPKIQVDRLIELLNEREREFSTAIGDGIATPLTPRGARTGVNRILGAFGRSTPGVDFESLDGKPTHLFFMIVAPEDSAILRLKHAARVSRLLKDPRFRERLLKAAGAAELYALLKKEDEKY